MTDDLSEYERRRAANIARNELKLQELGISTLVTTIAESAKKTATAKKRKRPTQRRGEQQPSRRSRRVKSLPAPVYTEEAVTVDEDRKAAAQGRKDDISSGWRTKDGRWRGERFGPVPGVEEGAIFGAGDYQRAGRFEMSKTGFFAPAVTPEWIDPGTKQVFSIVVNNDNGLSADGGDEIKYAGAGGRRRGQNRTAAQSFDQTWESATNAALRNNCKSGKPVRVIRGPKCGKHGTGATGGGYRYDGLFVVAEAEIVLTGSRKLKTCMFTLRKQSSGGGSSKKAKAQVKGGNEKKKNNNKKKENAMK